MLLTLAPLAICSQDAQPHILDVGTPIEAQVTDTATRVRTPSLDAGYTLAPTRGLEFEMYVEESGTYHIDLRSWAFDAYLVLRDVDGKLLAEDDDGLVATHSRIVTDLEGGHEYRVTACALHGDRGPFELALEEGVPEVLTPAQRLAAEQADEDRRLEWAEQEHGPRSPDFARILNNVGVARLRAGKLSGTGELLERALELREELLGPEHLDVAQTLTNLAILRDEQGRYAEAEALYERALEIRESALDPAHPDVLASLNNLAVFYDERARYDEAEPLLQRVLEIREEVLGPRHPDVAESLNNLAMCYKRQGRYAEAGPLYERTRVIWEKTLGPEHPDVALILSNLASLHRVEGHHAEAARLHERAVEIFEKALGPQHPRVARSLNNLAHLLLDQGRFAESEQVIDRAIAIQEVTLGPTHPEVARSLNGLAYLYDAEGRDTDAERLYDRALSILEEALGSEHPLVATVLNNLALLHHGQGRLAEAQPLHERALEIRRKALGPGHPAVTTSLNNLAALYVARGRQEEALQLLVRALAEIEEARGPEHPDVANVLTNLADLHQGQGRYAEAEPLYERALEIREKALDPVHPDAVESQNRLAGLHEDEGHLAKALALRARALRGALGHLDRELPVMSEADRFRLLGKVRGPGAMLAVASRMEDPDRRELLDLCLTWKGKVTRLQAASLALSRRADDAEVRARIGRLQGLQKQLSDLGLMPTGDRTGDHAERMTTLGGERLRLERELNRELGLDQMLATPSSSTVQSALPDDGALVDFHVGEEVFAWVLRRQGEPRLLALGDAARLRTTQASFLRATVTGGATVASRGIASPEPAESDSGGELRRRLWEPLREALGDAATVFVSPDGFLCELPLGILSDGDGGFLIEHRRFVYLSDAANLVRCDPATAEREGPWLAVGDVDYSRAEEARGPIVVASATRSRLGVTWSSLPATREELAFQRGLHDRSLDWEAPLLELEGEAATEEAVREALPGQRYVHLATHGYFEPDDLPSLVANAEKADLSADREAVGLLPGLLTGLVFAGANAAPEPTREDGFLSAEEIQYLDLSACDLAVLSACETALGSARAGNGLMSLRRAFEVAGARTVISSLWKVDDRAAAELMKAFYENYFLRDLGKAEALHQARLALLQRNRAEHAGDARPSTWGAFVLSGDWE
jgi:tetratricopeptide (TPR) repeat protein/CHAT domain-containing protein